MFRNFIHMQKLSEIFPSLIQKSSNNDFFVFRIRWKSQGLLMNLHLIETFSSFLFSQFKILETLHQQRLVSILLWITRLELKFFVLKICSYAKILLNLFILLQISLQRIICYQTEVLIGSHLLKGDVFDCNCSVQRNYWITSE